MAMGWCTPALKDMVLAAWRVGSGHARIFAIASRGQQVILMSYTLIVFVPVTAMVTLQTVRGGKGLSFFFLIYFC